MIEIRDCKYGKGVFATETIEEGQVVEITHIIKIPNKQVKHVEQTTLQCYIFQYGNHSAVALGKASLMNHSETPNIDWVVSFKKQTLKFFAVKPIRKGQQLFIDYGTPIEQYIEWQEYLDGI